MSSSGTISGPILIKLPLKYRNNIVWETVPRRCHPMGVIIAYTLQIRIKYVLRITQNVPKQNASLQHKWVNSRHADVLQWTPGWRTSIPSLPRLVNRRRVRLLNAVTPSRFASWESTNGTTPRQPIASTPPTIPYAFGTGLVAVPAPPLQDILKTTIIQ